MTTEIDQQTGERRVNHEQHNSTTPSVVINEDELKDLQSLSKVELVDLVQRFARLHGFLSCRSAQEKREAGLDRLASLFLYKLPNEAAKEISVVFDRWADREFGKPAMTVNQNVNMTLEQLVMQSYALPAKVIEHEES